MPTLPPISPEVFKAYQDEISKNTSPATAKRKAVSLNKFFDWASTQGHIPVNPIPRPEGAGSFVITPKKGKVSTRAWATVGITGSMVVMVFLLLYQLKLPIPFIKSFAQESKIQTLTNNNLQTVPPGSTQLDPGTIPANSAVVGSWNLFAKLKLTETDGSPRVGSETLTFKLFDAASEGTELYTSSAQTVSTDDEGSALISLADVPSNLFFENNTLFLEPQVGSGSATARIPVSTASTPAVDLGGNIVLTSESPSIKTKSGNLLIEGQTVTVKATDGSGGNLEFNPDANGIAHFLFEGSKGNFLNAQGPNLTSGSLYYGMVPNNATGYDLIRLQSGAPKMKTRFSVDALGNTYIAGNENVVGNLTVNGINNGAYYNQTSGNFTISQKPGDFAVVNKTVASGGALSDVLTLTLDERGKPATSNSDYSTLVLNRYDGSNAGAALKVNTGNAIFNGQLELGRYAALPGAIGQGSLVFNTSDNQVYVWDGTTWVAVGSGSGSGFDAITSGTNTIAAMIVGSGASLTYSGTGTVNASSLEGATWEAPGTIGSAAPNSGAFTSLNVSGLTASKVVFTDASKNLTSTGTAGADQGGTGFSSYAVGDLLYADTTATLAKLADVAVGNVLKSGGVNTAPSWGQVILGTDTTGNYVSSIAGTANQITASAATGDVTLSIPSDFRAPGTVNAVSGLYTGATAGTQRIDASGNLTAIGTTQINGTTYTWPASATAGYVLQSGSTGASSTLSWADPAAIVSASIYWDQALGAVFPKNNSVDVLIGSGATSSADFAFTGVNGGLPTASIAGNVANVATYLTGEGNLATTNAANLTIGGTTTGNVIINSRGSDALTADGANVTIAGDLAVNGGDITTDQTTFNLINATATTLNIGGDATTVSIGDATGTTTVNNALAVTLATNLNGDTTIGDAITDNITFTGRVAQDSDLIPITATGVNTLGTSLLPWDEIYGAAIYQGAYQVCDSSGANCPFSGGYWGQALGALYPLNNGVDLLIGSDSTASAKFAFINVLTGVPTASISGTTANVATYLTGEGNLATTNAANLTIGGTTTGNVIINSRGSDALTADGANVTIAGDLAVNGGDITTDQTTFNLINATATTLNIGGDATTVSIGDATGTTTVNNALAVTLATNLNGDTTIGDAITDNITFTGRVAQDSDLIPITATGVNTLGTSLLPWDEIYGAAIYQGAYQVCDSSGANCPFSGGYWGQALGALYPLNNGVDLLIGSDSTASAKFAFINVLTGVPTASISGTTANVATYLTGEGNLATTNAANLTIGGTTTGNVIINSRGSDALTADGANVTIAGDLAVNGGDITTDQTTFNLINATATTLNIGGDATTVSIGDATGTTTVNNALAVTLATNLNGDTTIGDAITDNITFTGRVAQDSDLIPITATGVNTLGTSLLPWDEIYGAAIYQGAYQVCDSSGANCPFSGGYWGQALGALYPLNNGVDLLIGSDSTASAKFAFINVLTGVPTASISGTTANVATYLTGEGNLATTNAANLTIGGTTTGNVIINSRGSDALTADGANVTIAGDLAVNGGDITTDQTTFNLINATATTLNIGGDATTVSIGDATGTTTVNNALAVTLATNLNGDTTIGDAITDNITFTGRVAQDSDLIPITATGVNTLGTSLLPWDEIYGAAIYQGAYQVCDSSGANCPFSGGYWGQALGALYPLNNGVDLLIGSDSTASAKFAFINVLTGVPTASISGTTANVATYLTGEGNLATTNAANLTIGGTTTGNVIINSRGSDALTADGANVTIAGDLAVNGGDITTDQTTFNLINATATTLNIGGDATTVSIGDATGTTTVNNALAVTLATNLNGDTTIGDAITDNITFTGRVAQDSDLIPITATGVNTLGTSLLPWDEIYGAAIYQGAYQVCDSSGANCPFSGGYWGQALGALYPLNNGVDLLIGSDSTASAKFAFINVLTGVPTASISGTTANVATYLTGEGNLATTNAANLTIGGTTTGNVIINSRGSDALTADGANVTIAGDLAVNGGDITTDQTTFNLINATATTLNIGGDATTVSIGDATGTTTVNNALAVTLATNLNGDTTIGDAITDNITFTGRVAQDSDLIPITATGVNTLGTSLLPWDEIYGAALFQNGNAVCDSTGANCPAGASFWSQSLGVLYPTNNTVDVLIGSSATASADFAFTGVNGGLPTASIAGTTANVATFLTGEGNLATTNAANLTIGGSTTGNVIINSRGSTALTADGVNLTAAGDLAVNGGDLTTTSATANLFTTSTTLGIGALTGTVTLRNALTVVNGNLRIDGTTGATLAGAGADILFSGTGSHSISNSSAGTDLTIDAGTTGLIQIGNTSTGDVELAGGATTGCIITNSTGALTCIGDLATTAGNLNTASAGTATLFNANATTLNIGGDATVVSIGDATGTTTINNALAVTLATNLNGDTTIGDAITDNITFTGRVAVDSDLIPIQAAASTNTLGTSLLPWDEIYGEAIYQGAYQVCDSSGANCPTQAQYWDQTALGVLYPVNSSVDVLIGGTATTSAKFAFTNVLTGIPTASIAGNIADVATFLTGNGTLGTTNNQPLNIGSATTGPVIIGSNDQTVNINSSDWDISTVGDMSGIGSIGSDGDWTNTQATPSIFLTDTGGDDYSINVDGDAFDVTNATDSRQELQFVGDGSINFGDNTAAKTIDIGGVTADAADIINIATNATSADIITIGNAHASTTLALTGGTSWSIGTNGNIANSGDLTITPSGGQLILADTATLNVGGKTNVAYNTFANAADAPAATTAITADNDLFVGGDLELKGGLYLTGKNIFNLVGTTPTATISFATDPSLVDKFNVLGNGAWLVNNDSNTGIAALMVNSAYATPDLIVASSSGVNKFRVDNNGDVFFGDNTGTDLTVGGGTGKIDVGTVDPPYTINGKKFATFLSAMTGVKEETAGLVNTNEYVPGVGYRSIIDFNNLPEGSDLWLFGKTTNIKENMDKLVALLTPSSSTRVWYDMDRTNKKLVIYSARPTEISYRLTGPRFDYQSFPNQRSESDSTIGFVINSLDTINNSLVVAEVQQLASFVTEKVQDGFYILRDSSGTIVDGFESIGNFVAGNIKAGAIQTQELLVSTGLVTPRAQIALISPIPGGTDVTVRLGNDATDSGKLAVQDNTGTEVASIDNQGNATFAGNVHSQNIDQITAMLNQVALDQSVLLAATSGANLTATSSANISQLIASDLYVTRRAAISSLLVTDDLTVGNINSLSEPLQLQSLALAPVEIMAGLVTIDTHGNVNIAGDLNVAGKITTPQLDAGIINATGSATFNSVATTGLIIGASDATVSGVVANGEINTSSTIGKAVISAGVSEITVRNPKVTDYTLVYVTPTSETQNYVLYIKEKSSGYFKVGFDRPLDIDVSFNWWVVEVAQ